MTDHTAIEANIDSDIANWLIRTQPNGEPTSIAEARQRSRDENALALEHMTQRLVPDSEIDQVIDSPAGPLPIRVLRPARSGEAPLPTVVYFHGGGWVVGDIDTHLGHARRICTQFGAVVVSVGYRLAPENRFPAAFEDAVFAAEWAYANRDSLGGAEEFILAGDSAGGQLAASTAIARRDAGQPVTAQLLLYPVTDVAGRYAAEKVNAFYMSRQSTGNNLGLTLQGMADFARNYVADDAESADWRVSPMRAKDLSGVAPAVIHTATLDVLRTEGNFYAHALQRAGVRVITREWPTLNHSYFGLGGVSAVADGAAAQAADDLRDLLAGGGSTEAPPERTLPSYP